MMDRPKFIFVGGINGSGKTTILRLAQRKNKALLAIPGSSLLMDWLKIKNGDYKKLQEMPDKFVKKELAKMIKYVIKEKNFSKKIKFVLFDAHFLNIIDGNAKLWINGWISLMDGIILIKSHPEEILIRIFSDATKKRNVFNKI